MSLNPVTEGAHVVLQMLTQSSSDSDTAMFMGLRSLLDDRVRLAISELPTRSNSDMDSTLVALLSCGLSSPFTEIVVKLCLCTLLCCRADNRGKLTSFNQQC